MNPQQNQQPPAGGTGRRSGRDRRHLSVRRRWRISPSFGDDEHTAIVTAAGRMGLTPTGYVATAALAAARHHGGVVTRQERLEQLAGLQAELFDARTALNRVGGNLNQAVAALNATGQAPVAGLGGAAGGPRRHHTGPGGREDRPAAAVS